MLASMRNIRRLAPLRGLLHRPSARIPGKTILRSHPLLQNSVFFSLFSTGTSGPYDGGDGGNGVYRGAFSRPFSEENEEKVSYQHTDAYAAIELALDSVVKVFMVSSSPNYSLPWQNKSQRESMGSVNSLHFMCCVAVNPLVVWSPGTSACKRKSALIGGGSGGDPLTVKSERRPGNSEKK
ncbi:uncharacterized protein [Elaeis guineensis]|uniref:uncharacterized protein n=1 Tax=Elaeis guineensis var. tenera TaxID=51953 RepID=UPI003C6D1D00